MVLPDSLTQWPAAGSKILVIDDVRINRVILSRMLSRLGFEVREASDGAEALALLREAHGTFVACVCDLVMPRLDGWGTVRAVRAMEADLRLRRLPIFCCTSECLSSIARRPDVTIAALSLSTGFDECMAKPPQLSVLQASLRKHVPAPACVPHAAVGAPCPPCTVC